MNYPDHIITIDDFCEFSTKEKGSVFTGQVYHCETEDEAAKLLSNVKKKFYDATHHCFAYKFIDGKFKYSDDGEPVGSAGIRILNAIEHFKLVNTIVIVIRYFGGVKLGVGPLGKAYYNVAFNVLEESARKSKYHYQKVLLKAGFNFSSLIHNTISRYKAIIVKTDYAEFATFECLIKAAELGPFKKNLVDLSKGEINISFENKHYYQ